MKTPIQQVRLEGSANHRWIVEILDDIQQYAKLNNLRELDGALTESLRAARRLENNT